MKLGALEDIVQAQGLQIVSLQHEVGALQEIIRDQAREAVPASKLVNFTSAIQQEQVKLPLHNRKSGTTNMTETFIRTKAPSMYKLTTDINKQKPHLQTGFVQERTKELIDKEMSTPDNNEGQRFLNHDTELDFKITWNEVSRQIPVEQYNGEDKESNLPLTPIENNIFPDVIASTQNEASISKNGRKQRTLSSEHTAFSAYLGNTTQHFMTGHVVKCDQVLLNDRQAYNSYTGIFTVPDTGVYLLTFTIATYLLDRYVIVQIKVNNRMISEAGIDVKYTRHSVMGGNTAIVRLNQGESVWLEVSDSSNGLLFGRGVTTFSGVLLY